MHSYVGWGGGVHGWTEGKEVTNVFRYFHLVKWWRLCFFAGCVTCEVSNVCMGSLTGRVVFVCVDGMAV